MRFWYLLPSLAPIASAFASSYFAIDGLNRFGNSESYIATLTIISNISTLVAYLIGRIVEARRLYKEVFIISSALGFSSLFLGFHYPSFQSYIISVGIISLSANLASLCLSLAIMDNIGNEELVNALKLRNLVSGISASLVSTFAWIIASNSFYFSLLIIMGIITTLSGFLISREIISTRRLELFNNSLKLIDRVTLYLTSADLSVGIERIKSISKSIRLVAPLLMVDRLLFGISSGMFFTSLPPFLLKFGGLESTYLILGLNSLASSLGYSLVKKVSINVGFAAVLLRALSVISVVLLSLILSPQDALLLAIPLITMGICWSFYDTVTSYIASKTLNQGSLSVYMSMINLGATIGGIVSGYIIQNFITSVIFAFALLIASAVILFILREESLHLP